MSQTMADCVDLTGANGDLVALTSANPALELYTGKPAPKYRKLYCMILDGELSAVQVRGRWMIDIRKAAEELGLA